MKNVSQKPWKSFQYTHFNNRNYMYFLFLKQKSEVLYMSSAVRLHILFLPSGCTFEIPSTNHILGNALMLVKIPIISANVCDMVCSQWQCLWSSSPIYEVKSMMMKKKRTYLNNSKHELALVMTAFVLHVQGSWKHQKWLLTVTSRKESLRIWGRSVDSIEVSYTITLEMKVLTTLPSCKELSLKQKCLNRIGDQIHFYNVL